MKQILIVFLLYLSGCVVPPANYKGTENIDPKNLSTLSFNNNEILILSIDDEEYTGSEYGRFYVESGTHRIKVKLNWSDFYGVGNTYVTVSTDSPIEKTACIELKPGTRYYLYARDPGPEWRFLVWEQSENVNEKYSAPLCN